MNALATAPDHHSSIRDLGAALHPEQQRCVVRFLRHMAVASAALGALTDADEWLEAVTPYWEVPGERWDRLARLNALVQSLRSHGQST